jgi:hypothetical protein
MSSRVYQPSVRRESHRQRLGFKPEGHTDARPEAARLGPASQVTLSPVTAISQPHREHRLQLPAALSPRGAADRDAKGAPSRTADPRRKARSAPMLTDGEP